jgi:hypothetical protein
MRTTPAAVLGTADQDLAQPCGWSAWSAITPNVSPTEREEEAEPLLTPFISAGIVALVDGDPVLVDQDVRLAFGPRGEA